MSTRSVAGRTPPSAGAGGATHFVGSWQHSPQPEIAYRPTTSVAVEDRNLLYVTRDPKDVSVWEVSVATVQPVWSWCVPDHAVSYCVVVLEILPEEVYACCAP